MRSLLYKDIVNLKQQFRFYLIILAFYVLLGIKAGDASFLGAIMTIFAVMLSVTACAYDEKAGWDKYALTMPFGVRELIGSKYLLALIGVCLTAGIMLPVNLFAGMPLLEALALTASWIAIGLFYTEAILPVIFRFGVEKGRIMMIVIAFLPTVVFLFLDKGLTRFLSPELFEKMLYIAPLVFLLFLPLSVWCSYRMYKKKEF